MPVLNWSKSDAYKAADIIRDAGGKVAGKTRLQKMAYLLEISGLGCGFSFEYRHYGPYSEELANGVMIAQFSDLLIEEEHMARWGGSYSIFRAMQPTPNSDVAAARKQILDLGVESNPISLELAATAAYLAQLPQLAGHCNFLGSEIGRAGAWDVSAARLFSAAVRRRRQRSRIDARKWRM